MKKLTKYILGPVVVAHMVLGAASAQANPDAGLYDPLPPEGSAFIRFVNDVEDQGSERAIANDRTLEYVEFKEISSYFVVEEGEVKASIGEADTKFDAEAGKFYTVILNDNNQLTVKEDPTNDNRAKAQIQFYNLSQESDLSVKTTDGDIEVISSVAPQETADRQINPVKVSLGVFQGDQLLKDLGDISLDRSVSYSIVAYDQDDIEWAQSTTNTVR